MTTVQVCRVAATVLAIAVAVLVMTACGGDSVSPPAGPDSEGAGPADALVGVFAGDAELEGGCAWLDVGGERYEVLWPDGYTVQYDPVRLLDPDGGVVAEAGDTLEVSGSLAEDMVSICQIGPLWQATDVAAR